MAKVMTGVVRLGNKLFEISKPHVKEFWYYGKVELAPPKISEIPVAVNSAFKMIAAFKSGAWKQLTVKQIFLNSIVASEVILWFFVGECIGKRKLVGYKVSPKIAH